MVAIRPETFRCGSIARSSKITHGPETGPETDRVTTTRERNTGLQVSALEAELVPGLEHARAVVEVVVLEGVETNGDDTVLGSNSVGIIPLRRRKEKEK